MIMILLISRSHVKIAVSTEWIVATRRSKLDLLDTGCVCVQLPSHVQLFMTPWLAHQDPLSMELSRQEYWSGLPLPPPGDLPDPEEWTQVFCIFCTGRQIFNHCTTWEFSSSTLVESIGEGKWQLHFLWPLRPVSGLQFIHDKKL